MNSLRKALDTPSISDIMAVNINISLRFGPVFSEAKATLGAIN